MAQIAVDRLPIEPAEAAFEQRGREAERPGELLNGQSVFQMGEHIGVSPAHRLHLVWVDVTLSRRIPEREPCRVGGEQVEQLHRLKGTVFPPALRGQPVQRRKERLGPGIPLQKCAAARASTIACARSRSGEKGGQGPPLRSTAAARPRAFFPLSSSAQPSAVRSSTSRASGRRADPPVRSRRTPRSRTNSTPRQLPLGSGGRGPPLHRQVHTPAREALHPAAAAVSLYVIGSPAPYHSDR